MLLLITEMDEGDPEFQQLTEEEIALSVIMASALEEGSDNELNVPQEFTVKKKLLSSARDSINAVISYMGSSTNHELQAYYEHLSTVREILNKGQQQRSVHAKLDGFLNVHYYVQKQLQLLSLLPMNKCVCIVCLFLVF